MYVDEEITEILSIAVIIVEREDHFFFSLSLWCLNFFAPTTTPDSLIFSITREGGKRTHGSSIPVGASISGVGPVQTNPTGESSIS